jgi:tetratricopeptide (TPR) repeat protein
MARIRNLLIVALLCAVGTTGVPAAEAGLSRAQALRALDQPDAEVRFNGAQRLGEVGTMADADKLVQSLRDATPAVREAAEVSLWQIWSRSGDPKIDALFVQGVQQMAANQLEDALATFSTIITRKPSFAEGWNKRATVLYLLGRYDESMKDCDEVLKRNPNHFGALSGYAQMLARLGQPRRAIEYLERALKVNPNMEGAQQSIEILKQELDARGKQMI